MFSLFAQTIGPMNRVFGRSVPSLVANSTGLNLRINRAITYEVKPSGEKVVIGVAENKSSPKEKWQRVRPMGEEKELRLIKEIEMNERLESDPKAARQTASRKLQSLQDSLRNRGFCRETKPYNPPQNVNDIIESVCKDVLPLRETNDWTGIALNDPIVKFKFLTKCAKQLNYEIPNSQLYLMKSVADVLRFYSTPIRGISSYDQMVANADHLPANLHVCAEPILFNQESDTYFGGVNAFPFSTYHIKGLRAKKKYPQFKRPFVWPDV